MKIVGIILLLVGSLWTFQGIGIIGGSFMTGQPIWLYIGVATAIVGLALLLLPLPTAGVLMRRPTSTRDLRHAGAAGIIFVAKNGEGLSVRLTKHRDGLEEAN